MPWHLLDAFEWAQSVLTRWQTPRPLRCIWCHVLLLSPDELQYQQCARCRLAKRERRDVDTVAS